MQLRLGEAAFRGQMARVSSVSGMPKVFVVGCAKSGTTWVQHLLGGHPAIVIDGEGAFGWQLLPELLSAVLRFNGHQEKFGLGEHTRVSDREFAAMFRFAVCQRMGAYLDRAKKDRAAVRLVGDKTPQHTVAMEPLAHVFPEAKFVHVVRDPRDAATSAWFHFSRGSATVAGKPFTEQAGAFVREAWVKSISAVVAAEAALPGRVCHVRYEDLQEDDAGAVTRVLEFLGVEADAGSVGACLEAGRFERLSGGRARGKEDRGSFFRKGVVGDWASHMSEREGAACCEGAGELMARFGYGVGTSEPVPLA